MTFFEAAAFQWFNPKGWATALGAVTAFTAPDNLVIGVVIVSAVFTVVMVPCIATWAGFGTLMQRLLTQPWRLRAFNVTMAVLLVASIYPMMKDLVA
jgi:threonine/homoserine/homoserine lactone efflux protein